MDFLYTLNKCRQILENRCAPDVISELDANEVYVFGAKPNGNHKVEPPRKHLNILEQRKDKEKDFRDKVMLSLFINIARIKWMRQ